MSSQTPINVLIQLVVSPEDERIMERVQKDLLTFCPGLSFSPDREAPGLNDCLECRATGTMDEAQKERLIEETNRSWDENEERTVFEAYGFNSRFFDKNIYYMEMEFSR